MRFNHKVLSVRTADRARFQKKATNMANASSSAAALNSIAQSLAAAAEAARGLDLALAQELRFLLHIAAGEAGRIRKASRKAAAPAKAGKKPAKKSAKKSTKAKIVAETAAPRQSKSGRKAAMVNGAAH